MNRRQVGGWTPWVVLGCLAWPAMAGPVQLLDERGGESYRLRAVAAASVAALAAGEVRLVCDYVDEDNYTYAAIQADQARIVARRQGKEVPLGTSAAIYRDQPPAQLVLALHRSPWSLKLICNEVICATAELPAPNEAGVGSQVTGNGLSLGELELQPTDEIYFADDFMRTDEQIGAWELLSGRWENNQQGSKSSRSANAFSFRSLGDPDSLVATGYPFWTDYCTQTAVRCDGDGAIGLAVGIIDAQHYYRLKWTSVDHPDGGSVRLQRVFDGQVTDLAPALPGGFRARVWYKLQVSLAGGRLMAWIDRQPLFDLAVQAFGEGRIGLWTDAGPTESADSAGALFDDVVVRSWPIFSDDFRLTSHGRWVPAKGEWNLTSGPTGMAEPTGDGVLISATEGFGELTAETDVRATSGTVGLLIHLDATGTGYALTCTPAGSALVEVTPDGSTVLTETAIGLKPDTWHHLSLSWDHGLMRSRLDGEPLLDGFDLAHPSGRVGLMADQATGAAFDNVTVKLRPTYFDLPAMVPADFASDEYMTTWAAPGAAWIAVDGSPGRWHKGFFFGDRKVSFSIPGFGQQTGKADLVLGATEPGKPGMAYRLRLTLGDSKAVNLALLRGDQSVAEASPKVDSDEPELVFELRSRFVLVWIDDLNVLRYEIPEGGA